MQSNLELHSNLAEIFVDQTRSTESETNVYTQFVNRTDRLVLPIWINFDGQLETYPVLHPGCKVDLETYETHPWCFLDANDLSFPLTSNHGDVYWPHSGITNSAERPCLVNIKIPTSIPRDSSIQQSFSHLLSRPMKPSSQTQPSFADINTSQIRSSLSSVKVYCQFVNCTTRLVAPIWIDFSGRRVRYPCINPGSRLNVETYEKHPWCFLDAQDLTILLTSSHGHVFWPRHNIPDSSLPFCIVKINLPKFSLRELCLQTITKYSIPTFSLPESLQEVIRDRLKYTNQISFVINSEDENVENGGAA